MEPVPETKDQTKNGQNLAEELLEETGSWFLRPAQVISQFRWNTIGLDALAGLTVALVMIPQAMAYALIAELPPQVGINAAIVASVVAILWGSSRYLHTGPTNTASLLVLSTLAVVAIPGSPDYVAAAGVMAVMVGVIRLLMGIARLGVLVNFVADSVVVGFAAGAGILIAVNQVRHVMGVEIPHSPLVFGTLYSLAASIQDINLPSLAIGLGTIVGICLMRWWRPTWPDALPMVVLASLVVFFFGLEQYGVAVVGELPRQILPLAKLPLWDIHLLRDLASGSLAIALIGLVEAMSIARTIATKSGERINANQEFIGQGLANVVAGIFSGYTCSGSFTRSAVNYSNGAKTAMAVIFSSLFVVATILVFAPLARHMPRAALAGLLVVTGFRLVDLRRISSVWRIARGDATIMTATFSATLLLPLEFAVLTGILVSFARHLIDTSKPEVQSLMPDENYKSLVGVTDKPECPQLGVMTIRGSLYFGATTHVEQEIRNHLESNPRQKFLLLHMQQVNRCDVSGLRMLETLVDQVRGRGGDLFLTGVHQNVWNRMTLAGFDKAVGLDHFLPDDAAIDRLFHRQLDPVICIYHCPIRVWAQCQTLPKSDRVVDISTGALSLVDAMECSIDPKVVWDRLNPETGVGSINLIDVREPVEFEHGHIAQARSVPMPDLLAGEPSLPSDRDTVFVCRTGRRSSRVIASLSAKGINRIFLVKGGMSAWLDAGLPQVID